MARILVNSHRLCDAPPLPYPAQDDARVRHSPEIQEVSIVVIGSFTPDAVTPHWLAFHGLISNEEAEEANFTSNHPSLSQIDLGWGKFYVDPNRIQFLTSQSPWVRAQDFILKLLTDVIPGTPSTAIGINISGHYLLSFDEKEKLGHRLAPREPWGSWGEKLNNSEAANQSNGLTSITMRQGSNLEHKHNTYIDANISSSGLLKPYGIRIYINDHYSYADTAEAKVSTEISAQILNDFFDASINRSSQIIDDILDGIKS